MAGVGISAVEDSNSTMTVLIRYLTVKTYQQNIIIHNTDIPEDLQTCDICRQVQLRRLGVGIFSIPTLPDQNRLLANFS